MSPTVPYAYIFPSLSRHERQLAKESSPHPANRRNPLGASSCPGDINIPQYGVHVSEATATLTLPPTPSNNRPGRSEAHSEAVRKRASAHTADKSIQIRPGNRVRRLRLDGVPGARRARAALRACTAAAADTCAPPRTTRRRSEERRQLPNQLVSREVPHLSPPVAAASNGPHTAAPEKPTVGIPLASAPIDSR